MIERFPESWGGGELRDCWTGMCTSPVAPCNHSPSLPAISPFCVALDAAGLCVLWLGCGCCSPHPRLPKGALFLPWLEEEFSFFREALEPASNTNPGASWLRNAAKREGRAGTELMADLGRMQSQPQASLNGRTAGPRDR